MPRNSTRNVRLAGGVEPGGPLWQRAPASDGEGRPFSDFMLRIPGLADWPRQRQLRVLEELRGVFGLYGEEVVFADLNLQINVLWVTVQPTPGLCAELAEAIQARVPEALLVGNFLRRRKRGLIRWLGRLLPAPRDPGQR